MSDQKVVWGEGMLLTPQHFQQWERHNEALARDRNRAAHPLGWGLHGLTIDPEALNGGEFRVRACAGTLPDGAVFDAPGRDRCPKGRPFADAFEASAKTLPVYLAMPLAREGAVLCAEDGQPDSELAPFLMQSQLVADEARAGGDRQIRTAVLNLKLLFGSERLDEHVCLPIAEVLRTDTGGYALDESFVPPLQQIGASPWLMQALRALVDMLAAKSDDLTGQQRKSGGMAEATGFWLLHTVNTHLPRLTHMYRQEKAHPETLYLTMSDLAAQLCTFAKGESPRTLPGYEHVDLRASFGGLMERLRGMLGTVVPTKCLAIALERMGDTMFSGSIPDASLFASAQFYIGVAADVEEERMIQELPVKTKISSKDKLQQLLMMAVSGLPLRHVGTPPQDIPVQPGRGYFQLEKVGEHWDAITASQTIAFHLPPDFGELRLDLLAVKD